MIEAAVGVTELSAAQSSSLWQQQQIAEEDIARFNDIYSTDANASVSAQPDHAVGPAAQHDQVDAAEKYAHAIIPTGEAYAHYEYFSGKEPVNISFSDRVTSLLSQISVSYENLFQGGAGKTPGSALGLPSDSDDLYASLQVLQETQLHASEVSMWSAQTHLLTSGISKGTQGIQMLFRNSG